jgi:hypothetical protein
VVGGDTPGHDGEITTKIGSEFVVGTPGG